MSKKDKALEKLGQVIQDLELTAGDRLPPERRLVELLDVSRNTLRSILHSLEARGLVVIRPGSGCYLRVGISSAHDNPLDLNLSPGKAIADQLEAAYMVMPMIAEQAAERIGERHLDELKAVQREHFALHLPEIRRTGVERKPDLFPADRSGHGQRLPGAHGGADLFPRTCPPTTSSSPCAGTSARQFSRTTSSCCTPCAPGTGIWARTITANYFLRMCRILEEREQVLMTDLVFRSLRERDEQDEREEACRP